MELEEAISQVSASQVQLERVLCENQGRLLELKDQEEQLYKLQSMISQLRDTHSEDLLNIEKQLDKTSIDLKTAEFSITIQEKTRACLDEILRVVFYSGRYNSDKIIDNDSILNMRPEFWTNLYEIVSLRYNDFFKRIETNGITLNENEKKVIALSVVNVPRAIIRRTLGYKNIQVVSNLKQKLAKKITGTNTSFDDIFN